MSDMKPEETRECIVEIGISTDANQVALLKALLESLAEADRQAAAQAAVEKAMPCLKEEDGDIEKMLLADTQSCIHQLSTWQTGEPAENIFKVRDQAPVAAIRAKLTQLRARAYFLEQSTEKTPLDCKGKKDAKGTLINDDIANETRIVEIYRCIGTLATAENISPDLEERLTILRSKARVLERLEAEDRSEAAKKVEQQGEIALRDGSALRCGVTTTLIKLQATRRASDRARLREYEFGLAKLPLDLGFQFSYRPNLFPWRIKISDSEGFQLISIGGTLAVKMDDQISSQSEITVGVIGSFFDESVSLGIGFDLYRGIPVLGSDGVTSGAGTAPTGLLAWAWSRHGELTPENLSLLLTVNLSKLAAGGGSVK
jgi:hypothetical protein